MLCAPHPCRAKVDLPTRYTDRLGIPPFDLVVLFNELIGGCKNYIAAATVGAIQAQCFKKAGQPGLVPDCSPPTPSDKAAVENEVRLYTAINPTLAPVSCYPFADTNKFKLRNSSFDYAYQGVMAGRYVCSQTANGSDGIIPCDNGPADEGTGRNAVGMYGKVGAFYLASQSQKTLNVNPVVGFNYCCDADAPGDPDGIPQGGDCVAGLTTPNCSPADIQCANAAIFAICRDGELACQDPNNFVTLNPVIWLDPVLDIEPGHNTTVTPSSFPGACAQFDFKSTLGGEQERIGYTTEGAFRDVSRVLWNLA